MKVSLFFLMSVMIFASCDRTGESSKRIETMKQANIVAGPGEKTFAEKYGLNISLPMSETDFFALLDRLKLRYEKYGERGTDMELPPPWHSETLDLSRIQKSYQIYGNIDRARRVGEMYRAYVDKDHRVVYIENAFSYTGP